MTDIDIAARLAAAALAGAALGLNRDLHHKAAGVRTIGLVSLAAAMLVVAAGGVGAGQPGFTDVGRIIQGVLTGVGFIGAGVIVRGAAEGQIHGLTTAAVIWMAAGTGVLCGIGAWLEVLIALFLVFALLILGRPLERLVRHLFGDGKGDAST
jgi:putative Mg2+ transporter-C (MgtC) family protein